MKILVIGGTHGNEKTGINLVRYLEKQPVDDVETLLAHRKAVEENVRFIETDLNRSANIKPAKSLEEKLALRLKNTIKKYDIVLDFHNTAALKNDCLIVNRTPQDLDFLIAKIFKLNKILIIPGNNNLISCAKKGVGIEFSNCSLKKFTTDFLVKRLGVLIKILGNKNKLSTKNVKNGIKIYKFKKHVLKIEVENPGNIINFKQLSTKLKKDFNLKSEKLVPVFYGEIAYKDNLFSLFERVL